MKNLHSAYQLALKEQSESQHRVLSDVNIGVANIIYASALKAQVMTRGGIKAKKFSVVSAPTGSSKTNSAKAYAIAAYRTDPLFTCSFVVEEIRSAQEIYEDLSAVLGKDDVGIWTSYHDKRSHNPKLVEKYGFELDAADLTDLEKMKNTRITVWTHTMWLAEMAKQRDTGVRRYKGVDRDVLFVDEQPNSINIMDKTPADILKVRDDIAAVDREHPWVNNLSEVAKRMDDVFLLHGDKHQATQLVEFLETYDFTEAAARQFWSKHNGLRSAERFLEGIEFLRACSLGYCFLSRQSPRSFVAYMPTFEPASNQVILDATADLSGLYPLLGGEGFAGVPQIDYSNLSLHHIQSPKEFKSINTVMTKRSRAEDYAAWIRETVLENTKAGDKVLLVVHKGMIETHGLFEHSPTEPDVTSFAGRTINLIWWGSGIGSNQYKDCTEVFLFSEFYRPRKVSIATTLGAQGKRADEAKLKSLDNRLRDEYLDIAEGDLLRWTKQLACRGNVRNVDSSGVCGAMRLHTTMDFSRLMANIDRLFPNVKPPVRTISPAKDNIGGRHKLAEVLSTSELTQISFKELETSTGIKSCDISRELKAKTVSPILENYGWTRATSKVIGKAGKGYWLMKKDVVS